MLSFLRKKYGNEDFPLEYELMKRIFAKFGNRFGPIPEQLTAGIITGSEKRKNRTDDFVQFTLDVALLNKFEDKKGRYFTVRDIAVFDQSRDNDIRVRIEICYGLLMGYAFQDPAQLKNLNMDKIEISRSNVEYYDDEGIALIKDLISAEDAKFINPNDVYELELEGKTYYHLMNLEDGDFLAVDTTGIIYKITHDPYELIPLKNGLKDYI